MSLLVPCMHALLCGCCLMCTSLHSRTLQTRHQPDCLPARLVLRCLSESMHRGSRVCVPVCARMCACVHVRACKRNSWICGLESLRKEANTEQPHSELYKTLFCHMCTCCMLTRMQVFGVYCLLYVNPCPNRVRIHVDCFRCLINKCVAFKPGPQCTIMRLGVSR